MRANESNTQFVFKEEDFPVRTYADYPSNFCDLQNENLFSESKAPMFFFLKKKITLVDTMITNCSSPRFDSYRASFLIIGVLIVYSSNGDSPETRRRF